MLGRRITRSFNNFKRTKYPVGAQIVTVDNSNFNKEQGRDWKKSGQRDYFHNLANLATIFTPIAFILSFSQLDRHNYQEHQQNTTVALSQGAIARHERYKNYATLELQSNILHIDTLQKELLLSISSLKNTLNSQEVELTQGHLRGISYSIFDILNIILKKISDSYKVKTTEELKELFENKRLYNNLREEAIQEVLDVYDTCHFILSNYKVQLQDSLCCYINELTNLREEYDQEYLSILRRHKTSYFSSFLSMFSQDSKTDIQKSVKKFKSEGEWIDDLRRQYEENLKGMKSNIDKMMELLEDTKRKSQNTKNLFKARPSVRK